MITQNFKQFLIEGPIKKYDNWRKLTVEEIKFEYMVEYPKLKSYLGYDPFPTEKSFVKAVQEAQKSNILKVTDRIDRTIDYRSRTRSIESLKRLVSSYQYPRDVDRIVDGITNNVKLPYPIVTRQYKDELRVFGGNTRMDVCFIMGIEPRVIVLDVPERVQEERLEEQRVRGFRYNYLLNPTTNEMFGMFKRSKYNSIRILYYPDDNELYVWDANDAIHEVFAEDELFPIGKSFEDTVCFGMFSIDPREKMSYMDETNRSIMKKIADLMKLIENEYKIKYVGNKYSHYPDAILYKVVKQKSN